MSGLPVRRPHLIRAALAACLLTAAGGAMDASVYVGHGHVFANAQSGNIALAAIAVGSGHAAAALRHLPSFAAFCAGIVLSRLCGVWLKRRGFNSRSLRLLAEAAALAVLAAVASRLSDAATTAAVGFLAALQITSLSHIGSWSFNTGMTTGNLRSALSAASSAALDLADRDNRMQAIALGAMCLSFAAGACAGAVAASRWGDAALAGIAVTVLLAVATCWQVPDPVAGQ